MLVTGTYIVCDTKGRIFSYWGRGRRWGSVVCHSKVCVLLVIHLWWRSHDVSCPFRFIVCHPGNVCQPRWGMGYIIIIQVLGVSLKLYNSNQKMQLPDSFKKKLDDYIMSLPDTPPTPSCVAANNNSILDWTVTSSRALPEKLSWDLVSNLPKLPK